MLAQGLASGGAGSASESLFVVDALSRVDGDPMEAVELDDKEPSFLGMEWDTMPKGGRRGRGRARSTRARSFTHSHERPDLMLYIYNFMPIEDYARMSQVNKSWNKAARKHPYRVEAVRRSEKFVYDKQIAERAEAIRRRDACRNCVSATFSPCARLGSWWGDHCCLATTALVFFAVYVVVTVLAAYFLFGPWPTSPVSLPPDELSSPPFQVNTCVVRGSLINTMSCYRQPSLIGYRVVFNVTINGIPNKAGTIGLGSPYMECSYQPSLRDRASAVALQASVADGTTLPCYADPQFQISYSFITTTNAIRSKEFAMLNFTGDAVKQWAQTNEIQTAGLYLGIFWCVLTFMIAYGILMTSIKVCC